MKESEHKNPVGRPPTGETPKRQVRIGQEWERSERLALRLAERQGTVRVVTSRRSGEVESRGDMAAYVEEALRRHNDRIERELGKADQA